MAYSLTDDEIKEFKEVFDLMDRDKGGTLSLAEVKQLMELLGMKIRPEELQQMVAEIDVDGSGQVDFEEFLQVMARPQDLPYKREDVLRAFKLFQEESDPKGCMAPDTLEKALNRYCNGKVSEVEIARLVSNLDLDEHGRINFEEVVCSYMVK